MIQGTINDRLEAVVSVRIRGPKSELDVNSIIDTGYTGFLAVPEWIVEALGLTFCYESEVILGDSSVRFVDLYQAEIAWDDGWRELLITSVGDEVVIGMQLLEGSYLQIAVAVGGEVMISPLQ